MTAPDILCRSDDPQRSKTTLPLYACVRCNGTGVRRKLSKAGKRKRSQILEEMYGDGDVSYGSDKSVSIPLDEFEERHWRVDACRACLGASVTQAVSLQIPESYGKEQPRFRVLIVGGGIAGFALGLALACRRVEFCIVERDTHFGARHEGYGLTMQQAAKVLLKLGFGKDWVKNGVTSVEHTSFTAEGKVIGRYGRDGQSECKERSRFNVHLPRQLLRKMLLDRIEQICPGRIHWGKTVVEVQGTETGVVGVIQRGGETKKQKHNETKHNEAQDNEPQCKDKKHNETKHNETKHNEPQCKDKKHKKGQYQDNEAQCTQYDAHMAVAADGIWSSLTKTPVEYLGYFLILGRASLDHPMVNNRVFQTLDGETRIFVMPFDQESSMWQLSFPIPQEADAKALQEQGHTSLLDLARCKCKGWHQPIELLLNSTLIETVTGYPAFERKPESQVRTTGIPLVCIGDAAHAMSPFKGQGANQAMVDALDLAQSIYEAKCAGNVSSRDFMQVLEAFEGKMVKRCARKVTESRTAASMLHQPSALTVGDGVRAKIAKAARVIQ